MEKHDLGYRSLKHLVYDFIRDQMGKGELKPDDPINMERTAGALGVSKTPLREALIKLETEGFVKRTYLRLADNRALLDLIGIQKKRLYEFARPGEFIREWEDKSLAEHGDLVVFFQKGEFEKAGEYLENTIWSFEVQRSFIVKSRRFPIDGVSA